MKPKGANYIKFESILCRVETRQCVIYATNRDDALRSMRESNPGFECDELTEIQYDDEPGEIHELTGECAHCAKPIWDDQKSMLGEEDEDICMACWKLMVDAGEVRTKP